MESNKGRFRAILKQFKKPKSKPQSPLFELAPEFKLISNDSKKDVKKLEPPVKKIEKVNRTQPTKKVESVKSEVSNRSQPIKKVENLKSEVSRKIEKVNKTDEVKKEKVPLKLDLPQVPRQTVSDLEKMVDFKMNELFNKNDSTGVTEKYNKQKSYLPKLDIDPQLRMSSILKTAYIEVSKEETKSNKLKDLSSIEQINQDLENLILDQSKNNIKRRTSINRKSRLSKQNLDKGIVNFKPKEAPKPIKDRKSSLKRQTRVHNNGRKMSSLRFQLTPDNIESPPVSPALPSLSNSPEKDDEIDFDDDIMNYYAEKPIKEVKEKEIREERNSILSLYSDCY